jgi:hypothetical protein
MIEQVDWNFCCKVADRMESDKQEVDYNTAGCRNLFSWDAESVSNYRQAGTPANRMLPRNSGLVFGIILGRGLGFSLDFRLGIVVFHTIL